MENLISRLLGFIINLYSLIAPKRAGRFAMRVFSYPVRVKRSEKHKAFLNAAKQDDLVVNGKPACTYKWGNGPKHLLMVHGWQGFSYRWKRLIDRIDQEEYTIHSLDAPGHGLSPGSELNVPIFAGFIAAFLEKEKIDAVVTHSLGGFSTLYSLYLHPDRSPEKLVLMGCPSEADEFVAFFKDKLKLSKRSIDALIERFRSMFNHGPEHFRASRFAPSCTSQCLIIHDTEDPEVPVAKARELAKNLPNNELHITTGYGHGLQDALVLEKVKAFLNQP